MTKIVTRPALDTVGAGPYTLKCTFEELQLIGAFVHLVRLGSGYPYREAAYNLIGSLTDLFDDEFTYESSQDVQLKVSQVDDQDTILQTIEAEFVVLEVN